MIYILCAPCKACEGLGKVCDWFAKTFGKCCAWFCTPVMWVLDRPLGGYVVFATAITVPAGFFGLISLGDKAVADCPGVQSLCIANFLLSIIHTAFAFYIQSRLVQGFADRQSLKADPSGQQLQMTSEDMISQAGQIMAYDIGFCLYFFVFPASFFYNTGGFAIIADCDIESSLPWMSATLMVIFGVVTGFGICYTLCWLWCDNCCASPWQKKNPQKQVRQNKGMARFILGRAQSQECGPNVAAGGVAQKAPQGPVTAQVVAPASGAVPVGVPMGVPVGAPQENPAGTGGPTKQVAQKNQGVLGGMQSAFGEGKARATAMMQPKTQGRE